MKVVIPSAGDKEERGLTGKAREAHQEVLEEEGVECPQGKASEASR